MLTPALWLKAATAPCWSEEFCTCPDGCPPLDTVACNARKPQWRSCSNPLCENTIVQIPRRAPRHPPLAHKHWCIPDKRGPYRYSNDHPRLQHSQSPNQTHACLAAKSVPCDGGITNFSHQFTSVANANHLQALQALLLRAGDVESTPGRAPDSLHKPYESVMQTPAKQ